MSFLWSLPAPINLPCLHRCTPSSVHLPSRRVWRPPPPQSAPIEPGPPLLPSPPFPFPSSGRTRAPKARMSFCVTIRFRCCKQVGRISARCSFLEGGNFLLRFGLCVSFVSSHFLFFPSFSFSSVFLFSSPLLFFSLLFSSFVQCFVFSVLF